MRSKNALDSVAETAKAYYMEAYKSVNTYGIYKEPSRRYRKALRSAEDTAFYDGFSEVEIDYARCRGQMQAMDASGIKGV